MCRVLESISVPMHSSSHCYYYYIQHNKVFSISYPLSHPHCAMQELHNKEMVMNAFAGFGNTGLTGWFRSPLIRIQSALAFIWCFSAFISWHTACINKQQEANRGWSMDLQCLLLFCLSTFLFFSSVCRIMPPCNSVPTNWIKRTSLENQTPSWSSTEVMRTAREFIFYFSAAFSF